MRKEITEDMKRDVIYLYKTHTAKAVGIIVGLNECTVGRIIKEYGIKKEHKRQRYDNDAIRADYLNGFTSVKWLMNKYNCSAHTVYCAVNGLIETERKPPKPTEDIINAIKQMDFTGDTLTSIAKKFDVSRQYVHKLKNQIVQKDGN